MKKAEKEETVFYPNNLIEELLNQKITGQMSAEFTERFEKSCCQLPERKDSAVCVIVTVTV